MNIFEKLKERGFDTVPESFYTTIGIWKSWYEGEVKSFHMYKVFNGQKQVQCRRYTMGMAKKVSEDWANLLMNEKVKITLEGNKEQDFFDSVCADNNFAVKISEMQELKAAIGTVAYIPRVVGVTVNPSTGSISGAAEAIKLDYCTAENIFPLSWENGKVKECAFSTSITQKDDKYLYLQIHSLGENGFYQIENVLYKDQNGNLSEVEAATVPGYENIPPVVKTGSKERQFVIDRMNIANNVDVSIPLGVSVYANAIDQLKGVDIAYDSYVNEFVLGKKRIMVKPEATKDIDGNPVFDPNDTVYYVLPEDTQNGSIIDQVDMTLRTAEHNAGLQDMLNALSSKCGFGEEHYKFDKGTIMTAKEVVSNNQTLQRSLHKHEIILQDVLQELSKIILRLGNTYMGLNLNEDTKITIDFDDSVFVNREEVLADMRIDVQSGLLRPEIYLSEKYGVTEKEALKMMPTMEDMVTKKQEEVE